MRSLLTIISTLPIISPFLAASATNILGDHILLSRRINLEEITARDAYVVTERNVDLDRRSPQNTNAANQTTGTASPGTASGGQFDEKAFNTSATQFCDAAIGAMKSTVNPAGMAACYNIPFFDNATGVFEADIRLYQITPPTGDFANTSPADYVLGVMIPQATLSNPQTVQSNTGTTVKMLRDFQHVGQLSTTLDPTKLSLDDARVLLIPNITLSMQVNGKMTSTTLSSDTLSYGAGTLVDANAPTNITVPEAISRSSPIVTAATKFTIPGVTLGIFPIGLIITGAWTLLFILAVGYGTFNRVRFREQYRRRAGVQSVGNVKTI